MEEIKTEEPEVHADGTYGYTDGQLLRILHAMPENERIEVDQRIKNFTDGGYGKMYAIAHTLHCVIGVKGLWYCNHKMEIPPAVESTYKIWRIASRGEMVVAITQDFFYVHTAWLMKEGDPFFSEKIENTPFNLGFYSSNNPHDLFGNEPVPDTEFLSLQEIEDWVKAKR
jgi:hypothetical protein